MKKFKFIPIYQEADRNKTNISFATGKSGIYLIKEDNKIVYVGHSASNLYKTITRHFQTWNDRQQDRIVYPKNKRHRYSVRIIFTTPKQSGRLEMYLINKMRPRDNEKKYETYQQTLYDINTYNIYQNTDIEAPF